MKNILHFNHIKAKNFFLKDESYFNFDLPPYFEFQNLILKISKILEGKLLSDFYGIEKKSKNNKSKPTYPFNYENVNYKFLNNKDGKFAWRPFQLIHPGIYVSLVHEITKKNNWEYIVKRFKDFHKNRKIKCLSLPIESKNKLSDKATSVSHWLIEIEQKSLELALKYEFIIHTDISDCYGSIYTHSIAWALHSKEKAKSERDNKTLIGNIIDKHISDMSFGQTNGIPQGSVLMDFIAEMILGFVDLELSEKIKKFKIVDFQILRYRDDYRIFSNNPQDGEQILKYLTEILIDLGMMLNSQKTFVSNNVVNHSIKSDKLYWLKNRQVSDILQENLLVIHNLSEQFPNSGTVTKELNKFFKKIVNIKKTNQNIFMLISILIDITFKNPKTYPISAAILSKLLSLINSKAEQTKILKLISKRFDKIPNIGYLQIWLQRITYSINIGMTYEEKLCKKVNDSSVSIWNSNWLNKNLKDIIDQEVIVNNKILNNINPVIESKEVELFKSKINY